MTNILKNPEYKTKRESNIQWKIKIGNRGRKKRKKGGGGGGGGGARLGRRWKGARLGRVSLESNWLHKTWNAKGPGCCCIINMLNFYKQHTFALQTTFWKIESFCLIQ